MKKLKIFGIVLLALVGLVIVTQYPKLTVISGYAAKNMASTVFLADRTPASINAQDHDVPLISLARTHYDSLRHEAASSVYGLQTRRAICRDGLGCALLLGEGEIPAPVLAPHREIGFDSLPYPYGQQSPRDTVFPEVDYQQVKAAIEHAFDNPEVQRTRTVLVLYRDQLIAERYADGFGPDTRILGWSMTKSVLATLYGILEFQGQVRLDQQTGYGPWQSDDRERITFEDLLRMRSGLEWDEDYSGISDVTRMLFLSADMPSVQASKKAIAPPDSIWNYSSGTSNFLSGLLRSRLGGDQEYLDFPYRELIDRIGMHSMLLETDLAGNYVGSSYGWASTRDWGRFGLLYLRKGLWNGERIFSPSWPGFVARPTAHSEQQYGAHFWLNAGGKYPDAPRDLYSANGYQGQYVFIIPSRDLVVVRTGLAEAPDFELNAFLGKLVAAFPEVATGP